MFKKVKHVEENPPRQKYMTPEGYIVWGLLGNQHLIDKLMEVVDFLRDDMNVVTIPRNSSQYFKTLEKTMLGLAKEMIKQLQV